MKVTKLSVNYSKGHKGSKCSLCVNYRPHDPQPASCSKVIGLIDPEYWCELFKKG